MKTGPASETTPGATLERTPIAEVNEALLIAGLRQQELTEVAEKLNAQLEKEIAEHQSSEKALQTANARLADHTEELERLVAERTRKLRETIEDLEGFSYSISHDMRAPLRAMQGYAQILVDEYSSLLDEQGANYLRQIMRSAVRLDHLIRDVLSYTKILHAHLPLVPVDLDRLVRDILETYPNQQPIKPDIRIHGTLPKVLGNEALLTQCVSNLVSNATKFVAAGITPHTEIWAEEREPFLIRLWFKDNGLGIAAGNYSRIFRIFGQIHPATEFAGTGIGLVIVRKAAQRMDAEVGFESKPGRGSSFWIQLKKA